MEYYYKTFSNETINYKKFYVKRYDLVLDLNGIPSELPIDSIKIKSAKFPKSKSLMRVISFLNERTPQSIDSLTLKQINGLIESDIHRDLLIKHLSKKFNLKIKKTDGNKHIRFIRQSTLFKYISRAF